MVIKPQNFLAGAGHIKPLSKCTLFSLLSGGGKANARTIYEYYVVHVRTYITEWRTLEKKISRYFTVKQ
jgi:hypothetical protein